MALSTSPTFISFHAPKLRVVGGPKLGPRLCCFEQKHFEIRACDAVLYYERHAGRDGRECNRREYAASWAKLLVAASRSQLY